MTRMFHWFFYVNDGSHVSLRHSSCVYFSAHETVHCSTKDVYTSQMTFLALYPWVKVSFKYMRTKWAKRKIEISYSDGEAGQNDTPGLSHAVFGEHSKSDWAKRLKFSGWDPLLTYFGYISKSIWSEPLRLLKFFDFSN